jgi:hypothetical protein
VLPTHAHHPRGVADRRRGDAADRALDVAVMMDV